VNMDEEAFGGGAGLDAAEEPDLVAHRRVPQLGDAQSRGDLVGKAERRMVAAARFDTKKAVPLRTGSSRPFSTRFVFTTESKIW
jgi:hypothetical protein